MTIGSLKSLSLAGVIMFDSVVPCDSVCDCRATLAACWSSVDGEMFAGSHCKSVCEELGIPSSELVEYGWVPLCHSPAGTCILVTSIEADGEVMRRGYVL